MNKVEKPMYEWKMLPWKKIQQGVFKLQKRIYQASKSGNVKAVRKLQRLLLNSWSAKCLAVRRVTEGNKGKKTAGIDSKLALHQLERVNLINSLKLSQGVTSTGRVWIAKAGKVRKHPLGIPTIKERAKQALIELALEPEWEAKFEKNSYGFRPGKSCHDAIEAVHKHVGAPKYVLNAHIWGCFDDINHSYLLSKLNTSPKISKQIKAWLKNGVISGKSLFPGENRNLQVGVISSLLANIALHGLEKAIEDYSKTVDIPQQQWDAKYHQISPKSQDLRTENANTVIGTHCCNPKPLEIGNECVSPKNKIMKMGFIRYGDKFVAIHENLEAIVGVKGIIEKWLKDIGLQFKDSKTKIVHTLNEHEGHPPGFDFLGFNVRSYRDKGPDIHKRKTSKGTPKEFVSLVKPSKEAIKAHQATLREIIRKSGKSITQESLIYKLNPAIKEFANYYKSVCWLDESAKLDHLIYLKLRRWALRRHPRKGGRWVKDKYWWDNRPGHKWEFKTQNRVELLKYSAYKVNRDALVKGDKIPYDRDSPYCAQRLLTEMSQNGKTRHDHDACIHY